MSMTQRPRCSIPPPRLVPSVLILLLCLRTKRIVKPLLLAASARNPKPAAIAAERELVQAEQHIIHERVPCDLFRGETEIV